MTDLTNVTAIGSTLLISKGAYVEGVKLEDSEMLDVSFDAQSLTIGGGTVTQIDRTPFTATDKVYVSGQKDGGTFPATLFYSAEEESGYRELLRAESDKKPRLLRFKRANGHITEFAGNVESLTEPVGVDEVFKVDASFKTTGERKDTFPGEELGK